MHEIIIFYCMELFASSALLSAPECDCMEDLRTEAEQKISD